MCISLPTFQGVKCTSNDEELQADSVISILEITADDDEKGIYKVYTLGGSQDMMLISESGLYTLIMRSNKPETKNATNKPLVAFFRYTGEAGNPLSLFSLRSSAVSAGFSSGC